MTAPHFNGAVYDPELDHARLTKQIGRVYEALPWGEWLTLAEIEAKTHDPQASISAQIRHLRKERFGGYQIDKRRRTPDGGTWEYRLAGKRAKTGEQLILEEAVR